MKSTDKYQKYAAFDVATITVSTSKELEVAIETLAAGNGGTVLISPGDDTIFLDVRDVAATEENAILIRSLDPDDPVVLRDINIMNSSYLTLTDVTVDSGDYGAERSGHIQDIRVLDSANIEIVGITMQGNGTGMVGIEEDAIQGENAVYIFNGQDITFSHNIMSGYFHGLGIAGAEGLKIVNNEIFEMQGDGIRGGGVHDALIADNYMHDFTGSANSVTHADMIQLWGGYPEGLINKNVEITGNILDSGSGMATQGILIQNDKFYSEGNALEGVYNEDIYIHNNLIHNGQGHGITVHAVKNAVIENNTVLWNSASSVQENKDADFESTPPKILLREALDSRAEGNVAAATSINEVSQDGTNVALNYEDPNDPFYAYDHIVGLSTSKTTDLSDLQFKPDSSLNGTYGAELNEWAPSDSPADAAFSQSAVFGSRAGVELSAEYSTVNGALADLNATEFRWTLEDGTVYEGERVVHLFDTPGAHEVELTMTTEDGVTDTEIRTVIADTREIYSTDFSEQGADSSVWNSDYSFKDPAGTAWGENGVFTMDGTTGFSIDRSNAALHFKDTLQIDVGFRSDEMADGTLFQMSKAYHLRVTEEGGFQLDLTTTDGKFQITTQDGLLQQGATQNISMRYDGPAGLLSLLVDDEVVGETVATGTIEGAGYSLNLGHAFGNDAHGAVEYLEVSTPDSLILAPSVPVQEEVQEPEPDEGVDTGDTNGWTNPFIKFFLSLQSELEELALQHTKDSVESIINPVPEEYIGKDDAESEITEISLPAPVVDEFIYEVDGGLYQELSLETRIEDYDMSTIFKKSSSETDVLRSTQELAVVALETDSLILHQEFNDMF